jgi:hypothetical protein
MKYVKILGLLAVAAAALMAFAGTAAADSVSTTTGGAAATPTIEASAEGHAVLDNPIAKIECASTVKGAVTSHGAGAAVSGEIKKEDLTFTGCTDSWHVTVVAGGTLSVESTTGHNGSVSSTGATVEATRFGISCRYITNNTPVGTVTGGSPATMAISASIPFHSGSVFCGEGATAWTGSYKVNSPSALYVANS